LVLLLCTFLLFFSSQIRNKVHPVVKKWAWSGQNDPNNFGTYYNSDTVLNYMLAMIMLQKMLVDVINSELEGDIGTEGGGTGGGDRGTAST